MKKSLLLLVLLAGCSATVEENETKIEPFPEVEENETKNEPIPEEVIVLKDNLVVTKYRRIESVLERFFEGTFDFVENYDEELAKEYRNVIILYNNSLYRELPPSTFGINELRSGDIYINHATDTANYFVLRTLSISQLESIFTQIKPLDSLPNGRISSYDFYEKSGTLVYSEVEVPTEVALSSITELNMATYTSSYSLEKFASKERIVLLYKNNIPYDLQMRIDINVDDLNERNVVRRFHPNGQEYIIVHVPDAYEILFFERLISNWNNINENPLEIDLFNTEIGTNPNLLPAEYCKIENSTGASYVVTGFPVSPNRIPTQGIVNIEVLFIDFDEYPGLLDEDGMREEFEKYSIQVDDYYHQMSNGNVKFNWRIHTEFIRFPKSIEEVNMTRNPGSVFASSGIPEIVSEIIKIADSVVDFTDTHMVVVYVNPSIPFTLADVSPAMPRERPINDTNEGEIFNATFIARDVTSLRRDQTPRGFTVIAHEMGHLFGLADLYNYSGDGGFHRFVGGWDMMGDIDNSNLELLAWQRFLLGWISDDQVNCINLDFMTEKSYTVNLEPLNTSLDNRLIAIRLDEDRVITIEKKTPGDYCIEACNGDVLISVVDGRIRNGQGPVNVVRPEGSVDIDFYDSLLAMNQEVTFENIIIKHTENYPNVSVIEVTINN